MMEAALAAAARGRRRWRAFGGRLRFPGRSFRLPRARSRPWRARALGKFGEEW